MCLRFVEFHLLSSFLHLFCINIELLINKISSMKEAEFSVDLTKLCILISILSPRAIYQTLPFCSFFQKVPFDMDFIWKMKMKSSFFIWNIKKTCAARGSLRSSPLPSLPPPTNPTQKFDISMFLYQKQKGGSFK